MTGDSPSFSIIVPTRARLRQLAACLAALARLEYPRGRVEVIVVDDGSPAPPRAEVEAVRDRIPIRLIEQTPSGPALARNTGAAQAGGDFLAFTDDDCAPDPDWLNALAAALAAVPEAAVGGQTINALPDNPYSAASQGLVDYLYTCYNRDPARARFFTSNNLAVPARGFRALGGFDPRFPLAAGEDREFCQRWRCSGRPLVYAPRAVVYHAHALSLSTFFRQQFNYGRGAFYVRALGAERNGAGQPPSFYLNLLAAPLSGRAPRAAAVQQVLLRLVSQAAVAAGYARAAWFDKNWI